MKNKKMKEPRIKDENGKAWTVEKFMRSIGGRKDRAWCSDALKAVKLGAYTFQNIVKMATSRAPNIKILVFIGNPTKIYPNGRPYTPEIIVEALRKRGIDISRETARRRLEAVVAGKSKEEKLLLDLKKMKNNDEKDWCPREILPDKRRKRFTALKAYNAGLITQPEYSRRCDEIG